MAVKIPSHLPLQGFTAEQMDDIRAPEVWHLHGKIGLPMGQGGTVVADVIEYPNSNLTDAVREMLAMLMGQVGSNCSPTGPTTVALHLDGKRLAFAVTAGTQPNLAELNPLA